MVAKISHSRGSLLLLLSRLFVSQLITVSPRGLSNQSAEPHSKKEPASQISDPFLFLNQILKLNRDLISGSAKPKHEFQTTTTTVLVCHLSDIPQQTQAPALNLTHGLFIIDLPRDRFLMATTTRTTRLDGGTTLPDPVIMLFRFVEPQCLSLCRVVSLNGALCKFYTLYSGAVLCYSSHEMVNIFSTFAWRTNLNT